MRVLYVSDNDSFGRRFNGYGNFALLRECGHMPSMLVWNRYIDDPAVHLLRDNLACKVANALGRRLDAALSCRALGSVGSYWISRHQAFHSADVVHLQLLHATPFFSLTSLPRLAALKPTLWTLHDPWALTGHCIHPMACTRWEQGCGNCPDYARDIPIHFDTSAFMCRYKRRMYTRADIDIIVASHWMRRLAERSPLLGDRAVHVVPFGVDHECFKAADGQAMRRILGIAPEAFVVCFRRVAWTVKSDQVILDALHKLPAESPVHIITVQEKGGLESLAARFPVTEMGWVDSSKILAGVYAAADVLLSPYHDSFGMMVLEALACGTPIICLEHSAPVELCRPPEAGLTVPENDPEAIVAALSQLIHDPDLHRAMREAAVRIAAEYSLDRHVAALAQLYAEKTDRFEAKKAASHKGAQ